MTELIGSDDLPNGWKYSPVRKELYCRHGVGHPLPSSDKTAHGCCQNRCCDPDKDKGWNEAVKKIEQVIQ